MKDLVFLGLCVIKNTNKATATNKQYLKYFYKFSQQEIIKT